MTGVLLLAALGGCGRPADTPPAAGTAAASAPELAPSSPSALPVAPGPGVASAGASADPDLPADVVAFRGQRDACDHFRGEEPYDAKRAEFLAKAVAKACTGTDKALAALRLRHAGDSKVIAVLKDYEDKIE